ncbi:hypothetical protein DL96DRAFT_1609465 [Flagelloscypha sp. PMI_526]|nr:hypothetical protein DL96DRAFT_1609465 [Flagelloscypha sp. PMI_526]
MRFAVITSVFVTALPFALAAPTGVVNKRVVNCFVAPCPGDEPEIKPVCLKEPCSFGGNFPFNKTENTSDQDKNSPNLPVGEPEVKPVCRFKQKCGLPTNTTKDTQEKDENSPNQPVGKPEIKPVCLKEPCSFGGTFPFNQTEGASDEGGEATDDQPEIKPVCAKEPCSFGSNFPFNETKDRSENDGDEQPTQNSNPLHFCRFGRCTWDGGKTFHEIFGRRNSKLRHISNHRS